MRIRFLTALAGILVALGTAGHAQAAPMTFKLMPFGDFATCRARCPEVISAEGEITNDTPRQFLDFVARNLDDPQMRSIVFLHSPGGGVAASMRLGQMFRKTGVLAIVARLVPAPDGRGSSLALPIGRCFSACVYALMGAKRRVVPPESLVGIHRMFFTEHERDLETGDNVAVRQFGTRNFVAQLSDYAKTMGVSRDLIFEAERIDPDQIHIVTRRELVRWRLATQKF